MSDAVPVANAYLQHLSDHDLELLAAGAPDLGSGPDAGHRLRSSGPRMLELLALPAAFEAVFRPRPGDDPFTLPSPFFVFSVAIHRTAVDLAGASYVAEWQGPRQRLPVLDVADLRDFLADAWRRLFLAQLLASYTHVASGSVIVPTRRGWRRQRFSELDPVRLAGLLDHVSDAERPGIYRRLGDLSLFLTGVFPDHTALRGFGAVEASRLLRAGHLRVQAEDGPGAVALLEELGRRWYQLAAQALPEPAPAGLQVLAELPPRFGQARRILNVVTDRFLFPERDRFFGAAFN